ncbi:putative leucine-rich repeat-containing protein DDB_G0290503 [Bactrocera oleae]|uniref:putative leucine-rich repeat-containing protein DDB_G0290503 n=1 Tax=Bactrocera oleae TaxID=104688 RepID=UPI00387E36FE
MMSGIQTENVNLNWEYEVIDETKIPLAENMEIAALQHNTSDGSEISAVGGTRNSGLAYDSGNYSASSNNSEMSCPFQMELNNHCQHIHNLLKERDQALFSAMQDVRKLRSELERLNKSEDWYKKELRAQKNTRLEALERIYAQERKYMQENQRLQRECVRLYEKCGDLEKELQAKRDKAMQKLVEDEQLTTVSDKTDELLNKFELEQQRSLVNDQEKLISVLRKQKHVLLEDLRRLNAEKDAKVLDLQETLAGVEVENTHMTAQCKRLLTERQILEGTLKTKDEALNAEIAEKLKMTNLIEELKEQSKTQQELLAHKEIEMQELQRHFNENIQNERNMDEVHRLSIAYHDEINAKTSEISSLKKSVYALQIELNTLTDLQLQNEAQSRHIDQLNFSLETQKCELKNLKQTDEEKTQQISELQQNLEKIRTQHDITLEQMSAEQSSLKSVKRELIALHEQYASMCALCEKTRFELEILEIENGKLRFQSDGGKHEIDALRTKLKEYLKHTEDLGMRINELEAKLHSATVRNEELEAKLVQFVKSNGAQDHFSNENEQIIIVQANKALSDRLSEDNNSFKTCEGSQTDLGSINDNEHDDSGFLEANNDSLNECVDKAKAKPDIQCTRDSDCATITAVNETLMQQLSRQSEILKERQILIVALEELICNGTAALDNGPSITTSVEDNRPFGELSERQQQLMEYLNSQSLLIEEKRKLLEAFESLVNEKPGPHEKSHDIQNISNIRKIIDESRKLKIVNTKEADVSMNTNIKDNIERDTAYSKELEYLQKQLLENDERHLKDSSEQARLHNVQMRNCEETIHRLQTENERLINDMQSLLEAKFQIENALEKQTQLIVQLKSKLSIVEVNENTTEASNTPELLPHERDELLRLRANVEELEKRLEAAMQHDEARRNERVRLIQQLIEQQNSKVKQLTESQEDWEELLTSLQAAQKLEDNARAELQMKNDELEELNALFAEQNVELRQLQEITLLAKSNEKQNENAQLQLTYQKEFETMQASLSAQLADSEAKQRQIEELQGKNERLERHLNEDYAEEMAKNQRQLRALQIKMEDLKTERNHYAARLTEMETELQQLKKSKRDGLVLPPEFVVLPKNTIHTCTDEATSSSTDANGNSSASESDSNERMRILTKVLEAEYKRKMKRYDLHIHTLLANIKKLKKALRATEQRAAQLTLEQCKTLEELRELRLTRRQLEEMRLKCEHNQITIKALEQALEMERKKFEASDLGKAANIERDSAAEEVRTDEPAHEVANLIDDYKKLIQQSALATRRPKTSTILDLIQRSNQCVPNLHKLDATVDGLRSDLEHFISAHTRNMRQTSSANKLDGPSLLDELRAATESY